MPSAFFKTKKYHAQALSQKIFFWNLIKIAIGNAYFQEFVNWINKKINLYKILKC